MEDGRCVIKDISSAKFTRQLLTDGSEIELVKDGLFWQGLRCGEWRVGWLVKDLMMLSWGDMIFCTF